MSTQRPGRKLSALAFSLFRYSSITMGLRTQTRPASPSGTSRPSSSTMRIWTVGSGGPTQFAASRSMKLGAKLTSPPVSLDP